MEEPRIRKRPNPNFPHGPRVHPEPLINMTPYQTGGSRAVLPYSITPMYNHNIVSKGVSRPLMPEEGGNPLAAILAAAKIVDQVFRAIKPATNLGKVYDNSNFGHSGSTFSKIVGGILDAGKSVGYGNVEMEPTRPPAKRMKRIAKKK